MSTHSKRAPRARGRALPSQRTNQRSFTRRYRGVILGLAGAIVIGGLVVIAALQASDDSGPGETAVQSHPLDPAVLQSLSSVPATLLQQVGTGTAGNAPKAVAGAALTEEGKPEVLYVGAEFCPFCAAERWPLFLALSRFGVFSGVQASHSAADDAFPNTPTLSFYGSTYTSPYLAFTAVEQYTNQRVGGSYEPLQTLTAEQQSIVQRYNQGGGIPYVYFAGKYSLSGANFSPSVLAGMSVEDVTRAILSASSAQSKAIVGSANVLTAALCQLTGGEPGSVCQSPEVVQAASQLK